MKGAERHAVDRAALVEAALVALDAPEHGYQVSLGRVDARDVKTVLDAALPLTAQAIESLECTWHFRGPGDPGIEIVSRAAVLRLVRSLAEVTP